MFFAPPFSFVEEDNPYFVTTQEFRQSTKIYLIDIWFSFKEFRLRWCLLLLLMLLISEIKIKIRIMATTTTTVTKKLRKHFIKVSTLLSTSSLLFLFQTFLPKLIISILLIWVLQDFIGINNLDKFILGFLFITSIFIWMIFDGEFFESFFYFLFCGTLL